MIAIQPEAANSATLLWSPASVFAAAVVAGFVGLVGHWINRSTTKLQARLSLETAKQTIDQSRDNARLQTKLAANLKLAEMRQAWIDRLRDDMASFQSLGVTPDLEHRSAQDFYRLGTKIQLSMNPADPDYAGLYACLLAFHRAKTEQEKYDADPAYVEVCQRILKREWDVLKSEIKAVAD